MPTPRAARESGARRAHLAMASSGTLMRAMASWSDSTVYSVCSVTPEPPHAEQISSAMAPGWRIR
ncbi:hypothetical protein AB4212_03795, partial [Streptomyces sp. 2MCAF27]